MCRPRIERVCSDQVERRLQRIQASGRMSCFGENVTNEGPSRRGAYAKPDSMLRAFRVWCRREPPDLIGAVDAEPTETARTLQINAVRDGRIAQRKEAQAVIGGVRFSHLRQVLPEFPSKLHNR